MDKVNVPEEWQFSAFGELVAESFVGLVRAAVLQAEDRQYQYLKMNNLNTKGEFDLRNLVKVDANEHETEKYQLKPGDFVFNTRNSAELVGKCGVFAEVTRSPVLFNNNLLKVIFYFINPKIVAYWLNSPIGKGQLRDITSATTSVAAIYQKQLFGLHLPIPPLAEQKVIADKLDNQLVQAESIKARLDRIPQILKTFRQSVLAAAVSGKLTENFISADMSDDDITEEWIEYQKKNFNKTGKFPKSNIWTTKAPKPRNKIEFISILPEGRGWRVFFLDDIILTKNQGVNTTTEKVKYTSSGVVAVQAGNISEGQIIFTGDKFISKEKFEILSSNVKPSVNDVLYTNIGANFGNAAVVPNINEPFLITWNVMKIVPSRLTVPKYLEIVLNSNLIRKEALRAVSTSTVPFVNGKRIGQYVIPTPTRTEQAEIVRRVEELFAFADNIEEKAYAALERINNLTQSILAKAFRGELTAQWRKDNPDLINGDNSAESLLAKIKAERDALSSKKKSKKKTAARKKA